MTEEELRQHVRALVAGYKAPRTIGVLDRLPRTSTGKIEMKWAKDKVFQAASLAP
ncbi:AMP-binding enzyme [Gordonia terrae]